MKTSDHAVSGEELMACLDGELEPARAAEVREHLTSCDACRQTATGLQRVSADLAGWQVEEPPPAWRSPRRDRRPGSVWLSIMTWPSALRASAAAVAGIGILAAGVWRVLSPVPEPPMAVSNGGGDPARIAPAPQASTRYSTTSHR